MGLITKISLRNLVRQKRRNFFLGIGIALGMCLLIIANSFANGITDILFNRIIVYMAGHINVSMIERTNQKVNIIRDKEEIKRIIWENVDGVKEIWETTGAFVRAVGNGQATSIALVGLIEQDDNEYIQDMEMIEGDGLAIFKKNLHNPLLIYESTAEDLNVKLNDTIRTRVTTVDGQVESATFTIVGIAKADNMFMATAALTDFHRLKKLLGLKEQETQGLQIIMQKLDNPVMVIEQADKLHKALAPRPAAFSGQINFNNNTVKANVFALVNKEKNLKTFEQNITLVKGTAKEFTDMENGAFISENISAELGAEPGHEIGFEYLNRFDNVMVRGSLVIAGIYKMQNNINSNNVFVHEQVFLENYYSHLPMIEPEFSENSSIIESLLPMWTLLERSPDMESSTEKYRELNKTKWKGRILDVQTMYELASVVLQLEGALNLISFIAVLILFFIILIGVVNTLRMSIRERTREIGTNRAIGMQKSDIRAVFVVEIFFLAIIACIVGIIFAFIFMELLGLINIDLEDNPIMLIIIDKHLHFLPKFGSIVGYYILIILITIGIAFFTARKAANMRAADALRHFE